ncbi:MAG: hypothetical protein ABJM29_07095 [Rhizobiaceae bacterium]
MKKATYFGSAFVTIALAATVLGSTSASAYQCQNGHHYKNGHGNHPQIHVAQALAKKSWQNKIKGEYGLAWSVWNIAKGKQLKCAAVGNGSKTCVARARPCKYVTG